MAEVNPPKTSCYVPVSTLSVNSKVMEIQLLLCPPFAFESNEITLLQERSAEKC